MYFSTCKPSCSTFKKKQNTKTKINERNENTRIQISIKRNTLVTF